MKFHESPAPSIRNLDRASTMLVLPLAACEQHGPHMPTGTDSIICEAVAEAVESKLTEEMLLLPTLWLGASHHHLPWQATLTADLATYETLIGEILEPLLKNGFRRVLLLNGHGGNIDPMRVALRRLQPVYPEVLLTAGSYWSIAEKELAACMEGEIKTLGHACEAETSLMLHLRPELVQSELAANMPNLSGYLPDDSDGLMICRDMAQRTQNGATGRPDLATAEKGAKMFDVIVKRVTEVIQKYLNEPLPERKSL
ncbi:MAG: creatininase family protein [Verrucomicrobiota bacterium]